MIYFTTLTFIKCNLIFGNEKERDLLRPIYSLVDFSSLCLLVLPYNLVDFTSSLLWPFCLDKYIIIYYMEIYNEMSPTEGLLDVRSDGYEHRQT